MWSNLSFKHGYEIPQGNLEMQKALEMGKNMRFSKTETWVNQTTWTGVIIQKFCATGREVFFLLCSLDSSGILGFDLILLALQITSVCKNLSRANPILGIPPNMLSKMRCKNSQSQGFQMSTQLSTVQRLLPGPSLDAIEIPRSYSRLRQLGCFKLKLYLVHQCSTLKHSFLHFWFGISRTIASSHLSLPTVTSGS